MHEHGRVARIERGEQRGEMRIAQIMPVRVRGQRHAVELELVQRVIEFRKTRRDVGQRQNRVRKKALAYVTDYSVKAGDNTVSQWRELYKFLFTKYMDGNVKDRQSLKEGYQFVAPHPAATRYPEAAVPCIAEDAGDKIRVPESGGH